MVFSLVGAIVSGVIATAIMWGGHWMFAPKMGMTDQEVQQMDTPNMLGSMFGMPGNKMMGLVMHFMMGIVFAVIYAVLFEAVTGTNIILLGGIFGVVHWVIVGLLFGMMPLLHAGIRSGDVPAPGIYMSKLGGMMGFIGGLIGHVVFGIGVGIVYGLINGSFGG